MSESAKGRSSILAHIALAMAMIGLSRAFFAVLQTGGVVDESAVQSTLKSSLPLTILSNMWMPVGLLLLSDRRSRNLLFELSVVLIPLLCLLVLTSVYSQAPSFALKEATRVAFCILISILVGANMSAKEMLVNCLVVGVAIELASIVFALALPTYGLALGMHSGSWVGVFPHKNHLGRFAAFLFMLALAALNIIKGRRLMISFVMVMSLFLAYKSKSSNAIFIILVGTTLLVVDAKIASLNSSLARLSARTWVGVVGALLSILIFHYGSAALPILGKESNLSGRADIWIVAMDAIADAPWIGYGISVFWVTHPTVILRTDSYVVPHAHNGFLDLLLSVGAIGAMFWVLYCLYLVWKIQAGGGARLPEVRWPLSFGVIYLLVVNILESSLLSANIYLFFALAVTFSAATSGRHLRIEK